VEAKSSYVELIASPCENMDDLKDRGVGLANLAAPVDQYRFEKHPSRGSIIKVLLP
jgi:hypothetical protein